MPINVDKKHWLAAKIDIVKRHIDLYDSSRASTQDWYQFNNIECLSVLFSYLLEVGGLYKERPDLTNNGTLVLDAFTISRVDAADCPQQTVSGDCGVFMLKFIEYLSSNRTLDFTQADIPLIRLKYAVDVFHDQLSL